MKRDRHTCTKKNRMTKEGITSTCNETSLIKLKIQTENN